MTKTIVHVVSLASVGGVQTSFMSFMSKAVNESKYKHVIISQHSLNKFFKPLEKYHLNINRSILNKWKFFYYLISRNHIIHFHNNFGSKAINKLLKLVPTSNVIFHEYGTAWNANLDDKIRYKQNQDYSDVVIACSNASKIVLTKHFGLNKDKIKVIYHTGLINIPNDLSSEKRYSNDFSVGFIGRFDTPKGIHVFIDAAKKIKEHKFYLAGEGILLESLKKQAQGFDNIIFVGVVNPIRFMSKIDLLIVPSLREPLGNIIIEAGISKKAVIAANVDGIPEIIKNNVNGILLNPTKDLTIGSLPKEAVRIPKIVVDPNTQEIISPKQIDINELTRKINELAINENLREDLGDALYNTVKDKFSIEKYFEELEQIYNTFK